MTLVTASSRVDNIRHSLVGLKMPRALEMLVATLRQIEQGQIDGIEALDELLLEKLSLRENRWIKAALRLARLPVMKTLAGFDFAFQPSLDRNRIMALAGLDFIARAEVVHLLGPPGNRKSHLSTALAVQAVRAGKLVYFIPLENFSPNSPKLNARAYRENASAYSAEPCCWSSMTIGYLPFTPDGGNLFFQLVNARYEKGAMILTSNRSFAEWGDIFGSPVGHNTARPPAPSRRRSPDRGIGCGSMRPCFPKISAPRRWQTRLRSSGAADRPQSNRPTNNMAPSRRHIRSQSKEF